MGDPFSIHWNVKGPVPVTATERTKLPPLGNGPPTGCTVMSGEPAGTDTVSTAAALVAEPSTFVTVTEYEPASDCWASSMT
jgi:hypothetical protein